MLMRLHSDVAATGYVAMVTRIGLHGYGLMDSVLNRHGVEF